MGWRLATSEDALPTHELIETSNCEEAFFLSYSSGTSGESSARNNDAMTCLWNLVAVVIVRGALSACLRCASSASTDRQARGENYPRWARR